MYKSLSGTTQYQACKYIPLAKETLDEAEGVSFGTQSERGVDTGHNATWLG
jgi:hypothetical protein